MPVDALPVIRDIAIIVMAVMVTVAAVTLTALALKLYPALRRATRNFEAASRLMLDTSARISALLTAGGELGILFWDLITRWRSRDAAEPPPDERGAA